MLKTIWNKFVNRETISYVIFGFLTTAVDWVTYTVLRFQEVDYRTCTVLSWAAAVLFAYVTNKLVVFQSRSFHLGVLWREFISFVGCRAATGILTLLAMIVMVDMMHLNDFIGKIVVSAMSLILNYVLSKLFIFKKEKR